MREATEATAVQREIGEAQVRAYLTATGGSFRIDASGVRIIAEYANKGQSPALSVRVKGILVFSVPAQAPRFPFDNDVKQSQEAMNTWGMVPVGGSDKTFLDWSFQVLGDDAIKALVNGKGHFRFDGALEWVDVFRRQHSIPLDLWVTNDDEVFGGTRRGSLDAHHGEPEVRAGERGS